MERLLLLLLRRRRRRRWNAERRGKERERKRSVTRERHRRGGNDGGKGERCRLHCAPVLLGTHGRCITSLTHASHRVICRPMHRDGPPSLSLSLSLLVTTHSWPPPPFRIDYRGTLHVPETSSNPVLERFLCVTTFPRTILNSVDLPSR